MLRILLYTDQGKRLCYRSLVWRSVQRLLYRDR